MTYAYRNLTRRLPIFTGVKDLLFVIAIRWRTIRSFRVRVGLFAGLYILTILLGLALNSGALFASLATFAATEESALARAWLTDVLEGNYGLLSLGVLGTAAGIVLLAPFTGASSLTLIDDDSSLPYGFVRGRRFLDSVVFSTLSGVGVVHLFVSVMIASIISVDGLRFLGIALAVLVWLMFLSLASAFGWLLEILVGLAGKWVKWAYGAFLAASAYLVYSIESVQGSLADGARVYGDAIRAASTGSLAEVLTVFVFVFAALIGVVIIGFSLARVWDGFSADKKYYAQANHKRNLGNQKGTKPIFFLARILWRTREVRRTLVAVTLAGVVSIAYFFPSSPESILSGIAVGIPVVSTLVWSSNAFGVTGSGTVWLFSQPKIKGSVISIVYAYTFFQSLMLGILFLAPLATLHSEVFFSMDVLPIILLAMIVNSWLLAGAGTILSIVKPHTVRLAGKGESILPPTASISYLISFGLFASVNLIALNITVSDSTYFLLYLLALTTISAVLPFLARAIWHDPNYQKGVLAVSTGD